MKINIKGSDLDKNNPVAYRIWKDTGIDEKAIDFSQKVITFRKDPITILYTLKNTPCLEKLYIGLLTGRSPRKCSFELDDHMIHWILWALDNSQGWYDLYE